MFSQFYSFKLDSTMLLMPPVKFTVPEDAGRVSDPDPDSVRSGDPDPNSESRSGFKRAKMTHK